MKPNPLWCKQTSEDLSVYNPPTTPATKRDQSLISELLHLVQNLKSKNSTLKESNQKLFNIFIKNIKTNSKLMESVKILLKLIKYSIEYRESWKKKCKNLKERNIKLSNKLSVKITQIKALHCSNDKYINENKVLKNEIKNMQEKIRKVYDNCDDLNRFNKE